MSEALGDPFALLGLDPSADIAAVYAARRRLAVTCHPDRGGDHAQMAAINIAVRQCVQMLTASVNAQIQSPPANRTVRPGWPPEGATPHAGDEPARVDHPSFRIEALPAEAHEALRIVSSWMGEVMIDDPPYVLESVLEIPISEGGQSRCWCQFHLLPEAGSSMVGLRVSAMDHGPIPPVRAVRDAVIAALNALDWDELEANPR